MKRILSSPLLLALSLLVVFSSCESQVEYSDDEISLQAKNAVDVLPSSPAFVGMMNIQDLSDSEMGAMIEEGMHGGKMDELNDLMEATGFNPKEDLKEVYMAMEEIGAEDNPGVSMVAYASLDANSMSEYIEERAGDELQNRSYRGVELYILEKGREAFGFSIANDDMILAASRIDLLEGMVDRLIDEGDALSSNTEWMDLLAQASTGKSAWFIAEKPDIDMSAEKHSGNSMDETARQIFTAVDHLVVAMNVDYDDVESQIFLQPNASVDAGDLEDLIKGLRSAMRSSPEMDDEHLAMLDEIDISTSRGQVRIQFDVEGEMLDRIIR
ncbi:MAG: hypothetical protein KTR29_14145 [Rhodothermaceae bacterium]|nr:hypothetical protein [Rhodothermaceae bacterium]